MRPVIDSFRGDNRWLSNFELAPLTVNKWIFPSNENLYQAMKSRGENVEQTFTDFCAMTPGQSMRAGRKLQYRDDWESIKVMVMTHINWLKYGSYWDLYRKLMATNGTWLVEGNTWKDRFWGVTDGTGANNLGTVLMDIRESLLRDNGIPFEPWKQWTDKPWRAA